MLSTTQIQWPCHKNCSHYRALIKDPTGQSEELCLEDQLLKFQLNPTVNVVKIFILEKCAVQKKSSGTSVKHTCTPYTFIRPTTSDLLDNQNTLL